MQNKDDFVWYIDENKEYSVIKREQLSNGQIIQIEFQETIYKKKITYNVVLTINNKKKQILQTSEHVTTGRCGLEGLLWAKKAILDFEKYILEEIKNDKIKIYIMVMWADNRRRNTYIRGLKNDGYTISKNRWLQMLIKANCIKWGDYIK